jgi:hypothetical protein
MTEGVLEVMYYTRFRHVYRVGVSFAYAQPSPPREVSRPFP